MSSRAVTSPATGRVKKATARATRAPLKKDAKKAATARTEQKSENRPSDHATADEQVGEQEAETRPSDHATAEQVGGNRASVVVKPSDEVLLNTATFRALLGPREQDIVAALSFASSVGSAGLALAYSLPVFEPGCTVHEVVNSFQRMPNATLKQKETRMALLKEMVRFLHREGVFNDSRDCNHAAVCFLSIGYTLKARFMSGGFDLLHNNHTHALVELLKRDTTEQHVLDCLPLASDLYLNTPVPCGTINSLAYGQFITPLKCAMIFNRVRVVHALLKRMPGVNFDLVHPALPFAEPLVMWFDKMPHSMQELIAVGARTIERYHADLPTAFRTAIENHIAPTVLQTLVLTYLARMPHPPPPQPPNPKPIQPFTPLDLLRQL